MPKGRPEKLFDQASELFADGDQKKAYLKISEIFSDGIEKLKGNEGNLYWEIHRSRLTLLNNLKRFSETEKYFKELENDIDESENIELEEASRIIMEMARAHWEMGDQSQAEVYLKEAISWDNKNQDAQLLFREMNEENDFSKAKYHKIMIEGKWDEPFEEGEEIEGFLVNYNVMADDENEALEFIKYFEPPEIHDSLKINEVEILKSKKQPKGVYGVSEYFFFKEDESAED